MAPPPEYDKEPKAPDKSATNFPSEDSKALYNLVNEHQTNSDSKSTNSSANAEVENNKHVETLDDGQLRALLDEAITYKCPKDREGKSSLFKELLEEVEQDEQDEQACSAAARLGGGRARRGGVRGRRALPHSNSLQDLVAALAAEPAPRRARHNHPPAPVSARAIHGGSLPSGVDTSFLLSEEPMRGAVGASTAGGAEYVATVRCVNPSPLAERRVSASDAHCPDTDALNRRSKPVFPMYTARATLEIGSGSVCSGRAVTTTTASNQVRTPATRPDPTRGGYRDEGKRRVPRGPQERPKPPMADRDSRERSFWNDSACVERWYRGLEAYSPLDRISGTILHSSEHFYKQNDNSLQPAGDNKQNSPKCSPLKLPKTSITNTAHLNLPLKNNDKYIPLDATEYAFEATKYSTMDHHDNKPKMLDVKDVEEAMARQAYRERVGQDLVPPSLVSFNPKNVRSMSIGPSLPVNVNTDPGKSDTRDKPKDKYNRNTRNRNERNVNVNVVTDKPTPAAPADNNKPDSQRKSNHQNALKTRSPSPRNRVKSNAKLYPSAHNKNTKQTNKDNVKEKPHDNDAKTEKDTGLDIVVRKDTGLDIVVRKEKSQNGIELTQNDIEHNEVVKAEETKEDTKLDEMVKTKEISHVDLEHDEMVSTIERSHNDERNVKENPHTEESRKDTELVEMVATEENRCKDKTSLQTNDDTNLVEMISLRSTPETENSNEFSLFMANQQRLLLAIESYNYKEDQQNNESNTSPDIETSENIDRPGDREMPNIGIENPFLLTADRALDPVSEMDCCDDKDSEASGTEMVEMKRSDTLPQAELPGTASYFLTLYKRLLTSPCNIDNTVDIKPACEAKPALAALDTAAKLPKKKKDKITARLARKPHNENSNKKKDIIRNALKKLFFDNITQSDSTKLAGKTGAATREVDSAIPFSCITTPEVVASCTTTASAQAAVAVDPKPLQLRSSCGAVASLTGACELRPAPRVATNLAKPKPARSMASTFNGVPLPRAGPAFSAAAAVAQAAAEEFKKSLDENGNSVQGFSSPQSGSSQQKKQRRKKSSKNETVIKSHHIDGYQGNKDLNEVLRFIESNEPERPKRHDDKKKRSAERRKDKAQRASSLDDLSRAAPPPARPARPAAPAPKPERRSWGDERQPFYFRDPNPEPDPELTDFQTVTKKRKPRRRADEPSPRLPRRAPSPRSPPSPRARSDRSNDSNDDLDSVHSLPALPCRPAPPASYADIARTKHNIPDLIESCNYYGEGAPEPGAGVAAPAPAPGDADGYPALEGRARRARTAPRARGKERDEPAPDVVADRPPVILLESAGRARELDGVTFGFDIDERLLGAARRPRVDLLAREPVPVRAGARALRYVQPPPPPPHHRPHLHQIVDYVGTAWEDVVRCGSGKVRYFSE